MSSLSKELHQHAVEARKKSYSPYSKFQVGAAVKFQGEDKIYSGCNIENSSYGGCICAERVAILKGLSELGEKKIEQILVVTGSPKGDNPCGLCLQTINEFSTTNTEILIANLNSVQSSGKVSEFLPNSFDSSNLP